MTGRGAPRGISIEMQICRTVDEMRGAVKALRADGDVGLVPTMGALHAGHMNLVAQARAENAAVVTSIFVNPTQFGDPKDLETYPRDDEADLAALEAAGVAAVFMPSVDQMYPDGDETIVETTHLANVFHGLVRPGHFRGVATVVTKLLNIVTPDRVYFGQKDYQQLAVIRRMVRDMRMAVEVRDVATAREADGVAMSSRNKRLTTEHRAAAPVLNQALAEAEAVLLGGASVEAAVEGIRARIAGEPLAELKAIDVVDAATFEPATGDFRGTLGMMISAQFGEVLLIDQREVTR